MNLLEKIFKWSITISIVYKSLQLIVRIYNITILNIIVGGNESYRNKLHFIIDEAKIEKILNYIITISFFILFSTWLYIKYKNAHKQSRLSLTYKPIWALFSFIIPIFNLFAPFQIMNEIWRVYNKDISVELYGKKLIKTWWFLSVGIFIFSRYIGIKFDHVSDLAGYLSAEYYYIIYFAVSIHYYLLLNKLVSFISR